MSMRTLIETNHDFLHECDDRPELHANIIGGLGMSLHGRSLNEMKERGRA